MDRLEYDVVVIGAGVSGCAVATELAKKERRIAVLERESGLLPRIDQAEDDIDAMRKRLIDRHIERLNQGECRAESSGVFINLVSNLERLGDHLTYIAYTVQV